MADRNVCPASVADANVAVIGVHDQLVFALFMAAQPLVELEELGADPQGKCRVLFVVEHPLGPLDQVAEVKIQSFMLAAKLFCQPAKLGRHFDGILEVAVSLLQREMQGQLVAELAQLVDQQTALARRDWPLTTMPQVREDGPQLLIDFFNFL